MFAKFSMNSILIKHNRMDLGPKCEILNKNKNCINIYQNDNTESLGPNLFPIRSSDIRYCEVVFFSMEISNSSVTKGR